MSRMPKNFENNISADQLLERIPILALSGEDSSVDLILFETIKLLVEKVDANIGQVTLLPMGGRLEKLCILKDGKPWQKKIKMPRYYDSTMGFTGKVINTGKSILIKDIWEKGTEQKPNPFIELVPELDIDYVIQVKKPVASIIILPVKHDGEVFCTIELSRYRKRKPFDGSHKKMLDDFTSRYGRIIIDYVLDIKARSAVNTSSKKLLNMARLIASNRPIDYREVVKPYINLSSADAGMAWFKTGAIDDLSFRMIIWRDDEIREILLNNFSPSDDSILRDSDISIFPVEEGEQDRRLINFSKRLLTFPGINENDRQFVLETLEKIKSYVVYSLHMLSQELGAIALASFRPRFWKFLHMNPFLSLYNSLLKSFLLNERVIQYLWDTSRKVHNPGFYCLGTLKSGLLKANPSLLFQNEDISRAFSGLEKLLSELHEYGTLIKWRSKKINLGKWIQAFFQRKAAEFPMLKIEYNTKEHENGYHVLASDEQLETIFENLFANCMRAISSRQAMDRYINGKILISAAHLDAVIEIVVRDNGIKYETVSGRGVNQIHEEMKNLKGDVRITQEPYQTFLYFPNEREKTNHSTG